MSVALFKYAASTVYFVANVGSELLKSLQPLTLSAFESRTLDFTDWASTVKTNGLPMVGVYLSRTCCGIDAGSVGSNEGTFTPATF